MLEAMSVLVIVSIVVFFAAIIKGMVGFGMGSFGTALLAVLIAPADAAVLMVVPVLATNIFLLDELRAEGINRCVQRFWQYLVTVMAGTVIGVLFLRLASPSILRISLGLIVVLYAFFKVVDVDTMKTIDALRGDQRFESIIGLLSGMIFGASNIGIHVVAYLDSLSLNRQMFVGVIALVMGVASGLKLGLSWHMGLFRADDMLFMSVLAGAVSAGGVFTGKWLRPHVPEKKYAVIVTGLLAIIGLKLLIDGLTV